MRRKKSSECSRIYITPFNKSTVDGRQSTEKKPWTVDYRLWAKRGFTLVELLVVLVILGFFVAMMAKVFTKQDDQRRFDETRMRIEEIKKAILGSPGAYANGQRQFAGYIADMGGLPILYSGQPKGLWDDDPDGDETPFDPWQYQGDDSRIWCGWRGPYIEKPPEGILKDGWGNPFVFDDAISPGDLIISSPGANGMIGATDKGFDEDIVATIKHTAYMAPVAGRVIDYSGVSNVTVTVYGPVNGSETPFVIPTPPATQGIDTNGYFRFEQDGAGHANGKYDGDIPVGLRSIVIADSGHGISIQKVFTIEPTGNWLGDIDVNP